MIDDMTDPYIAQFCAADITPGYLNCVTATHKPTILLKVINQYTTNPAHFPMILNPLKEYFYIQETNSNNYDVIIDGPFANNGVVADAHQNAKIDYIEKPDAFKIFFTGEPTHAKVKGYDLSLGFDYLEDDNYIRYPLYYNYYFNKISTDFKKDGLCNPTKEYFACFLVRNSNWGDGAGARNDFFHELSTYKMVTSGGPYLNNIGRIIPGNETSLFLSKCKFNIAFENHLDFPGYMTEKLFQAYFYGSLPLYSSNPEAQKEVNTQAFVSRQSFNSNAEMIERIKELDQDNQKYCEMWNQPITTDPSRNYPELAAKVKDFIKQKFVEPYYQKMKVTHCQKSY